MEGFYYDAFDAPGSQDGVRGGRFKPEWYGPRLKDLPPPPYESKFLDVDKIKSEFTDMDEMGEPKTPRERKEFEAFTQAMNSLGLVGRSAPDLPQRGISERALSFTP